MMIVQKAWFLGQTGVIPVVSSAPFSYAKCTNVCSNAVGAGPRGAVGLNEDRFADSNWLSLPCKVHRPRVA